MASQQERFDAQMKLWERINGDIARMADVPEKPAAPEARDWFGYFVVGACSAFAGFAFCLCLLRG